MNNPLKLGLLILLGGLAVAFLMPRSGDSTPASSTPSSTKANTVSEFQKIDSVVGNGTEAKTGSDVSVHYTGWLHDPAATDLKGKKFDSSVDRGQAFEFPLGGGRVIKGWDEGVAGMKVGGKRTLIIPAEMGYGARGAGGVIPPNATLVFDVELLGVR
jgi:FKBP-type peptidyl-prolyl cis-trans isomerase FkpA